MKKSIFLLLAIAFTWTLKAQVLTQATTPQTIANYIPGYSQVTTVNTVSFSYTPTTPAAAPTPVDGDTTTEDNGVYNYGTIIPTSVPLTSGNYTNTTSSKVWTVRTKSFTSPTVIFYKNPSILLCVSFAIIFLPIHA